MPGIMRRPGMLGRRGMRRPGIPAAYTVFVLTTMLAKSPSQTARPSRNTFCSLSDVLFSLAHLSPSRPTGTRRGRMTSPRAAAGMRRPPAPTAARCRAAPPAGAVLRTRGLVLSFVRDSIPRPLSSHASPVRARRESSGRDPNCNAGHGRLCLPQAPRQDIVYCDIPTYIYPTATFCARLVCPGSLGGKNRAH